LEVPQFYLPMANDVGTRQMKIKKGVAWGVSIKT
jgi:hypothetical protein